MLVTSSFPCENCGIKVSGAEGSECPGCGQSQTSPGRAQDSESSNGLTNYSDANSISPKTGFDSTWIDSLLNNCKPLSEGDLSESPDNLVKLTSLLKASIAQAPDAESSNRANSFLSEVYRQQERYKESFESAVPGTKSNMEYFKYQAYNSILVAITALDLHEDYEEWIDRAKNINFAGVDYHAMCYLVKNKRFDEALEACERHYTFNLDEMVYNRADILKQADRTEESERNYFKLIAKGPKSDYFSNSINSLTFSIMIPQGRYVESEKLLASAICTENEREKVNAYSNLAMVAFHLKEFSAAKRYATVGSKSKDPAIASESRLTLCNIEFQRLFESENSTDSEWESLFNQIILSLESVDFDDAGKFLQTLLKTYEKSPRQVNIAQVIDAQYARLTDHPEWSKNEQVAIEIEFMWMQVLSQSYLKESKYSSLDQLFIQALEKFKDLNFIELIAYLRTPFAGIEIRRGALQIRNVDFLTEWASFEQVPEILYGLSKSEVESVLVSLAENPAAPEEVCVLISSKVDLDLDYALSNRATLSYEMIQILSKSPFDSVRKLIAQRGDLDDSIYTQLATDSAILVRDAIKANINCSPEIKALAALGSL